MRAAVLREYNAPLSIEDVAEPACPDDGVVLKVMACGVCRSDWHGWVGEHPRVKPGQIGGHEYCGEVIEAGAGATYSVGDKLIAPFILACGTCPNCRQGDQNTCDNQRLPGFIEPGAFAEYVAVPRDHNLALLPETLSPTVAAGLGCRVTTAWHALTGRAALQPGEWLAVHGTGGIGLSCLLLGIAMGARVVVVDIVDEKLTHAKGLGAEAAVNATSGDVAAQIKEHVRRLSGQPGALWHARDAVVEIPVAAGLDRDRAHRHVAADCARNWPVRHLCRAGRLQWSHAPRRRRHH